MRSLSITICCCTIGTVNSKLLLIAIAIKSNRSQIKKNKFQKAKPRRCCDLLHGVALNRGLKWFFSKNRPSSLIEAFGSYEKGWLVCVDLLRTNLFDVAAIFRHDGLQAAAERAAGPEDVGRRHPVPLPGDGLA